jgi:hypothetical protein
MARRPFKAGGARFSAPPRNRPTGGSYTDIVRRGEIAFMECRHCIPPYQIEAVHFDEPPWNRFLNRPTSDRFCCPGCGHRMVMHIQGGTGIPYTDRYKEEA